MTETPGTPGTPENPEEPESFGDSRLDWESPDYVGPVRRRRSSSSSTSSPGSAQPPSLGSRWRRLKRKIRKRTPHKLRRLTRGRWIALIALVVVLLPIVAFVLAIVFDLLDVRHAELLPAAPGPASAGRNIVLIGSEAAPPQVDGTTLVIQLAHVSGDGASGEVIDIPRDLLLPATGGTLADALAQGGPRAVATDVQALLGLNVDNVIQVDFHGYAQATDDVGGADVLTATGRQHMSGSEAEIYAAQPGLPGGTVETGGRYQQWVKAIMIAGFRPSVLLNPFAVLGLADHSTSHIVADNSLTPFSMVKRLWSWRNLGPTHIHFFTIPNQGYAPHAKGNVLRPDPGAIAQLGNALRTDNLATIGIFGGR